MDESRSRIKQLLRAYKRHQLRSEGSDLVHDSIEAQGRAATALISALEVIPLADFYIEVVLTEMDLTEEPWVLQDITTVRCAREQ